MIIDAGVNNRSLQTRSLEILHTICQETKGNNATLASQEKLMDALTRMRWSVVSKRSFCQG